MGRLNLLRFASEIEFVFIGNSQTGVKYRTLDTTNSQYTLQKQLRKRANKISGHGLAWDGQYMYFTKNTIYIFMFHNYFSLFTVNRRN